jgi:hypothetical protein
MLGVLALLAYRAPVGLIPGGLVLQIGSLLVYPVAAISCLRFLLRLRARLRAFFSSAPARSLTGTRPKSWYDCGR